MKRGDCVAELEYRLANRIICMRKPRMEFCLAASFGQLLSILNQTITGLSELKVGIQQYGVCTIFLNMNYFIHVNWSVVRCSETRALCRYWQNEVLQVSVPLSYYRLNVYLIAVNRQRYIQYLWSISLTPISKTCITSNTSILPVYSLREREDQKHHWF